MSKEPIKIDFMGELRGLQTTLGEDVVVLNLVVDNGETVNIGLPTNTIHQLLAAFAQLQSALDAQTPGEVRYLECDRFELGQALEGGSIVLSLGIGQQAPIRFLLRKEVATQLSSVLSSAIETGLASSGSNEKH